MAVSGGTPLGRYVLLERLGVGGMGEVHLAIQGGPGEYQKPLAVKLLLPSLAEDPAAVEMFLREARVAARMNHSNVVQIFDVGEEAGYYFMAMELVRGVSLAELIRGLKAAALPMPAELVTFVGRSLCDGLHHAHEQTTPSGEPLGLVHRDISPHNVLVSDAGDVKLTDFGIAKVHDASTRPGIFRGKLAFASPEQVQGHPVDRRSDIFSLGVTLFELATGTSPFERTGQRATLEAVVRAPLPRLRETRPDISEVVEAALARATAKDREGRFPTARAFRDAFPSVVESDAKERLAQLLREVCREPLRQLAQKTEHAFTRPGTQPLSGSVAALGAPTVTQREVGPKRTRRVGLWIGLGLAAAGIGAAVGVVRWSAKPAAPTPAVVPAIVSAVPVAVTPPPAEPIVPLPAPVSKRPTEVRPRPPAPREAQFGYLNVDVTPWATVSVNGKVIGDTPIGQFPIPRGPATVTLTNAKLGKTVVRKVEVSAGRRIYLREDLR